MSQSLVKMYLIVVVVNLVWKILQLNSDPEVVIVTVSFINTVSTGLLLDEYVINLKMHVNLLFWWLSIGFPFYTVTYRSGSSVQIYIHC